MSASDQQTAARSWRGRSANTATVSARKQQQSQIFVRLLSTLALLALVALFVWMLIPRSSTTYLITSSVWYEGSRPEKLLLHPIPFAHEDIDALEQLQDSVNGLSKIKDDKHTPLKDLADQIADLGARDNLIVYVSAHGVAFDGKAYLLDETFFHGTQKEEWLTESISRGYPLTDLLKALAHCRAQAKILIIDTGGLVTDTRLGILVNEFPRAAWEELKDLEDESLLVLLSNDIGQPTATRLVNRQSVFGNAVVQALSHVDADQTTTCDEFRQLVIDNVASYVPQDYSHPLWLAYKSPSKSADIEGLVLVNHRLRSATAATSKEEPEQDQGKTDESEQKKTAQRISPVGRQWLAHAQTASNTLAFNLQAAPADTVPAKGPESTPATAGQPASGTDAPAATAPTAAPTAAPASATPAKPETKPALPPAAELTPEEQERQKQREVVQLILEIWELRDELQSRTGGLQWSPIDFAPHHWRSLETRLLDEETRFQGRSLDPQSEEFELQKKDLKALKSEFQDICFALAAEEETGKLSAATGLLSLWNKFRAGDAPMLAAWEGKGSTKDDQEAALQPEWTNVRSNLRLAADARYHAVDYVQLYQLDRLFPYDADIKALLESLINFNQALPPPFVDGEKVDDRLQKQLGEVCDVVRAAQDKLNMKLDSILSNLATGLETLPDQEVMQRDWKCRRLLQTPLLSASQRRALYETLEKLESRTTQNEVSTNHSLPAQSFEIGNSFSRWVSNRLLLEEELVKLAEAPTPLPPFNDTWGSLQVIGKDLRERFQKRLQIVQQSKQTTPGMYYTLMQLDGRDASRLDDSIIAPDSQVPSLLAHRLLPPLPPDRILTEIWAGPDEKSMQLVTPETLLPLDPDKPQRIRVKLSPRLREKTTELRWRWGSFNDTWIKVQRLASKPGDRLALPEASISPDDEFYVGNGTDEATIEFVVKNVSNEKGRIERLDISAHSNTRQDLAMIGPRSIQVKFPDSKELRLLVHNGLDSEAQWLQQRTRPISENDDCITIRTFAGNRVTPFRFSLENTSPVPREVQVELFQVPEDLKRTWERGHLYGKTDILDSVKAIALTNASPPRPKSNLRLLAATPPITEETTGLPLPAESPPVLIPLAPPAPPAGGTGTPPPTEGVEITDGLLCVITDAKQPDQKWFKWIELEIIHPKEYVTVTSQFKRDSDAVTLQGRLSLEAGLKTEYLAAIPGLKELPVEVSWPLVSSETAQAVKGNPFAMLMPANPTSRLAAIVNSRTPDSFRPRLSIDHYPRAMTFKVNGLRDGPVDEEKIDKGAIRIRSLRQVLYAPGAAGGTPPPASAGDDANAEILVDQLRSDEPICFKADGETRSLQVKWEADAFDFSFGPDYQSDKIQLSLVDITDLAAFNAKDPDDRGSVAVVRNIFADRQRSCFLEGIAGGVMLVRGSVADWQTEFPPERAMNLEYELRAQIDLPGKDQRDADDVRIRFDGSPPTIADIRLSSTTDTPDSSASKIYSNQNLHVTFRVSDKEAGASGVDFKNVFVELLPDVAEAKPLQKVRAEGQLSTDRLSERDAKLNGEFRAVFELKGVEGLKPGKAVVKVTALDRVGHSTLQIAKISIEAPPPPVVRPMKTDPEPKKGTFIGDVKAQDPPKPPANPPAGS